VTALLDYAIYGAWLIVAAVLCETNVTTGSYATTERGRNTKWL